MSVTFISNLNFRNYLNFILYVWVFCLHVCLCSMWESAEQKEARRGRCITWIRVTDGYEPPHGNWAQVLRKSSLCCYPLSHLSRPSLFFSNMQNVLKPCGPRPWMFLISTLLLPTSARPLISDNTIFCFIPHQEQAPSISPLNRTWAKGFHVGGTY